MSLRVLAGWAALAGAVAVLAFAAARAADSVGPVQAGAGTTAPAAPAAASGPRHRPLRENRASDMPPPTDPQVFSGDPGAPAFTVVPRQPHLALYPCAQCHQVLPLNTTPRTLVAAPHPAALVHGQGRMWCLDCHAAKDRNALHTLRGEQLSFDQSHLLCAQCHSARHKDWSFGGHGKRVEGWTGNREIYSCTHCHDPHKPSIDLRAASSRPPVRAGLQPMSPQEGLEHLPLLWQRLQQASHEPSAKP